MFCTTGYCMPEYFLLFLTIFICLSFSLLFMFSFSNIIVFSWTVSLLCTYYDTSRVKYIWFVWVTACTLCDISIDCSQIKPLDFLDYFLSLSLIVFLFSQVHLHISSHFLLSILDIEWDCLICLCTGISFRSEVSFANGKLPIKDKNIFPPNA